MPGSEYLLCAASIEQARLCYRFTRADLEPRGGYRFLDSATRIGITHTAMSTVIQYSPACGHRKIPHALVNPSSISMPVDACGQAVGGLSKSRWARRERKGTPQGSPILPLFSNSYMRRFILGWKVLGYARRFEGGQSSTTRTTVRHEGAEGRPRWPASCSHAARGMRVGPSEPPGRGRLQTAVRCFGQEPRW